MTMLEHTIFADWNAWYSRRECGVNRFLGGDAFVCHRPCSPHGNGSFCEYHGQTSFPDVDLTWKARIRSILSLPKRAARLFHDAWLDLQVALRERDSTYPTCSIPSCGHQAICLVVTSEGHDWFCSDHFGP